MADHKLRDLFTVRWDASFAMPTLFVTMTKPIPTDWQDVSQIIDQTHLIVDRQGSGPTIVVYDVPGHPIRFSIDPLMKRSHWSTKVVEVVIVGELQRPNEMTILIAANAKRLPYCYRFFHKMDDALAFLRQYAPASSV